MAHKKKMNAAALAAYREENTNFLANLEGKPGIQNLRCGVKYRVITPAPPAPEGATERTLRKLQSTPATSQRGHCALRRQTHRRQAV